ncbi:T9SS type A sorting domain-containing protein, partial [Hymenobacter sp. BT770]
ATAGTGCTATVSGVVVGGPTAGLSLVYSIPTNSCGQLRVTAAGGTPPYVYTLRNASGTLVGTSPSVADGFTFMNLATGVYTATVVDAHNCVLVCPTSIAVTGCPPPCTLALTAGNVSTQGVLCFGGNTGSLTAVASGAGTAPIAYELVGTTNTTGASSGIFTGLTAGTYTVRATAGTGCTATVSGVVVGGPTAGLSLIYGIPGGCGQLTLTATGGTGPYLYSLYSNVGTIYTASTTTSGSFTFTGLPTGTYTGFVVDHNGCTLACLFGVNITGCPITIPCNCTTQTAVAANGAAVQSGKFEPSLAVFPNPVTDKATVEFRVAEGQAYSLSLYDMVGRLVRTVSTGVGQGTHTSKVALGSGLDEGIYLMRLTTGSTVKTIRLNVQK